MDLVVLEGDVALVDVVPLLDLLGARPCLRRHQLLEVADGVVLVALGPHLLPQAVVQHHLDHLHRVPMRRTENQLHEQKKQPTIGIDENQTKSKGFDP